MPGAQKRRKKGQGCFLGPLKGEGPVIYHWIPGDWCSLTWGPIFPNDIREEPSRMKKCYTSLRSSQDCWNQCFNNSLAVSGGRLLLLLAVITCGLSWVNWYVFLGLSFPMDVQTQKQKSRGSVFTCLLLVKNYDVLVGVGM